MGDTDGEGRHRRPPADQADGPAFGMDNEKYAAFRSRSLRVVKALRLR